MALLMLTNESGFTGKLSPGNVTATPASYEDGTGDTRRCPELFIPNVNISN